MPTEALSIALSWVLERQPYAPEAEGRIDLLLRVIGELLVAARVQSSHGDDERRIALEQPTVGLSLLVLRREGVPDDEGDLGAVETDTVDKRLV